MLILGLDPGTAIVGYALLESEKNRFRLVSYGSIQTSSHFRTSYRLRIIEKKLARLIKKYQPREAAVEDIFFFKNQKTAVAVSQARGVILLTLEKQKVKIFEYTPLQVKSAVSGFGKAPKEQVQRMVKTILGLPKVLQPDDVSDAAAIAICHAHQLKVQNINIKTTLT
ncbi:MAG: crossover junction endodeoxyribonuclease RuvC [Candidatus Moranbacteria bacterium]|nr:crossover junction endodeoxyribonuclease RuvC [Candidatus Moranbacteria bacterium]